MPPAALLQHVIHIRQALIGKDNPHRRRCTRQRCAHLKLIQSAAPPSVDFTSSPIVSLFLSPT